jgi:hypothetical protein
MTQQLISSSIEQTASRAEGSDLIVNKESPAFCNFLFRYDGLICVAKLALIIYVNVEQLAGLLPIVFLYRFENLALSNLPLCPVREPRLRIMPPTDIAATSMITERRYRRKFGV